MNTKNCMKSIPALDTSNGKASGDLAAAGKVANVAGGNANPQAALAVGSTKAMNPYTKKGE